MVSVQNDAVYYMKGHKLHSLKMGRYKIMEELAKSVFVSSVIEKMDTKDTNIRSLGIGSSKGDIESIFTKQLSNNFGKLGHTAIEPAEEAIAEYKRLTAKNNWSNVDYSWFHGTFQQFKENLENEENATKYHHISSLDSVYYLENPEDDILFMYNMLENGGMLMIMLDSDENSYSRLAQRFPEYIRLKCISSKEVIAICQQCKFEFQHYHHECNSDITDFFLSNILSAEEKIRLDFIMQTVDFKENVSESFYKEVINYIKSSHCSKLYDGKVLLKNDFDVIFIQKKC
ncbi:histamine N-methyltransferase B-like [Antedon mediterranea]|uniref:histamine N-methyltransferase B-like n=1 Tax=Antedon mediterranea TaxID=105859 RepID=UPI003AF6671B